MNIETKRLIMIPETPSAAEATAASNDALAAELHVTVPTTWPPEIFADSLGYWAPILREHPEYAGWAAYYMILREGNTLVGLCGFTGPPADGRAEIGYAVLPAFQCRGLCKEAVMALLDFAFADPRVDCVVGQTLRELVPSIKVMESCGFAFDGEVEAGQQGEPNAIQYAITREQWDTQRSRN